MSADIHKYGLGAKVRVTTSFCVFLCQLYPGPGLHPSNYYCTQYIHVCQGSSVIVYRNADIRKYQIFAYSEWPGGLFGSPSMSGTRPGQI